MKTLYILPLLLLFLCYSCSNDPDEDIVIEISIDTTTNDTDNANSIGGTLTENLILEFGQEYVLTEALIVPEGITLSINAGVIIRANTGADVFVAIEQGGIIEAQGTSSNPIVFTSNATSPNAGDWGGIIVLGRAPINSVTGGNATSTSEIGGLPYGGNNPNDSSGIIRYVRVEYSGGSASASSENNGFTFYAVGNGTTIEYIQTFEGLDDGVEFFGGTVNVNYISVIGAQDDSVDWTEGFSGTLTDVYIEHRQAHDKGVEGDGFNTDIGNNSSTGFFSFPTINNITIIGLGSTNQNEAVRLRAGTRVQYNNIFIQGYQEGFELVGDAGESQTGQGVVDNETQIVDVTFNDVTTFLLNNTGFPFTQSDLFSGIGNGTGTDYISWSSGWTRN